jgi:hypothetical protein
MKITSVMANRISHNTVKEVVLTLATFIYKRLDTDYQKIKFFDNLKNFIEIMPHRAKNSRINSGKAIMMQRLCKSEILNDKNSLNLIEFLIKQYTDDDSEEDGYVNRNDYDFVLPALLKNDAVRENHFTLQKIWDMEGRRQIVREEMAHIAWVKGKEALPTKIYKSLKDSKSDEVQKILNAPLFQGSESN